VHTLIAKYLILAGIVLIIAGVIYYFFQDKFGWIGRLPGDIRIENGSYRFYFPVTTLIIISVVLNVLVWLVRRWL
jgi:hypothetical protein